MQPYPAFYTQLGTHTSTPLVGYKYLVATASLLPRRYVLHSLAPAQPQQREPSAEVILADTTNPTVPFRPLNPLQSLKKRYSFCSSFPVSVPSLSWQIFGVLV